MTSAALPVVVIGAGPVGLAAAARLIERGLAPLVLERGEAAGAAVSAWGHVRLFSPWSYNVDAAARVLLEQSGWRAPPSDELPTGDDLVRAYLAPLAAHGSLAPRIVRQARVTAVSRLGLDKLGSADRDRTPFIVVWKDGRGAEHRTEARAVIDASGTWTRRTRWASTGCRFPASASGRPHRLRRSPTCSARAAADYAGRRVLVVGGGHSAINVRARPDAAAGAGAGDEGHLGVAPERHRPAARRRPQRPVAGARRARARGQASRSTAGAAGAARALRGRARSRRTTAELLVEAQRRRAPGGRSLVDRIVVATGSGRTSAMLRELRLARSGRRGAAGARAADRPEPAFLRHGAAARRIASSRHPEPGFYIVGMKSYGRAPTFLMATGYEQVRSVVAEIAGDHDAARRSSWCCRRPASAAPEPPRCRWRRGLLRRTGAGG